MYCTVITSSKASGIGSGLSYESAEKDVKLGQAVRVPLRNKLIEGIVIDVAKHREKQEYDLKQVAEILDGNPLLTKSAIETARWVSSYYCCSLRSALGVWLPPAPWSNALPKAVVGYSLSASFVAPPCRGAPQDDKMRIVRGKKQQAVIETLQGTDWMPGAHLMQHSGASPATIIGLAKKGILTETRRREEVTETLHKPSIKTSPKLTAGQEVVYQSMKADQRPSLLFGITGSGKTELYAQMIADTVNAGKQALLLLPEILLTEHFIGRFEQLLDRSAIAIIHSRLTESEKRNEWKRIHCGEVGLVIGSRSALFSPLPDVGLVILDEEHEWTYKNEQTPRYHARETAETLCRISGAKLVLGSATPSLESWARAKSNHYHLARLPGRYLDQPLPTIRIVDLAETEFGNHYPLSPSLIEALKSQLEKKEQTVLFLNRRGVATALLCLECRRRVICPDSQLPFTVHHARDGRPYLLDHTTGITAGVPTECPHCKSPKLLSIGAGTQRIEILLKRLLPTARVIRADSDTMKHPEDIRTLLRKMRSGEADILLGTQSVVKGLDLPNVTLAAVLIADVGLSIPGFRAGERIFQLLTQLTGRSGRSKPGDVIIQTFRPDAPEIASAAKHETEVYLENELKIRIYGGYPPFSKIIRLITRDEKAENHAKRAYSQASAAILKLRTDAKVSVAPTLFGAGREWHVLIRGADPQSLLSLIDLKDVVVDVDPVETI